MDYIRVYKELIHRAKSRVEFNVYTETHHILPKCMGGNNNDANLVKLTAREHFIAHRLLVKIYPNENGLKYSLFCFYNGMNNFKKINSREYEDIRKVVSSIHRERMKRKMGDLSAEERKAIYGQPGKSNPFYGMKHNEKVKTIISENNSGKTVYKNKNTGETACFNVDSVPDGFVGINEGISLSDETKLKISKFQRGRKKSKSTREKMSISARNRKPPKLKICPHCGIEGRYNIKRYHFENCKRIRSDTTQELM